MPLKLGQFVRTRFSGVPSVQQCVGESHSDIIDGAEIHAPPVTRAPQVQKLLPHTHAIKTELKDEKYNFVDYTLTETKSIEDVIKWWSDSIVRCDKCTGLLFCICEMDPKDAVFAPGFARATLKLTMTLVDPKLKIQRGVMTVICIYLWCAIRGQILVKRKNTINEIIPDQMIFFATRDRTGPLPENLNKLLTVYKSKHKAERDRFDLKNFIGAFGQFKIQPFIIASICVFLDISFGATSANIDCEVNKQFPKTIIARGWIRSYPDTIFKEKDKWKVTYDKELFPSLPILMRLVVERIGSSNYDELEDKSQSLTSLSTPSAPHCICAFANKVTILHHPLINDNSPIFWTIDSLITSLTCQERDWIKDGMKSENANRELLKFPVDAVDRFNKGDLSRFQYHDSMWKMYTIGPIITRHSSSRNGMCQAPVGPHSLIAFVDGSAFVRNLERSWTFTAGTAQFDLGDDMHFFWHSQSDGFPQPSFHSITAVNMPISTAKRILNVYNEDRQKLLDDATVCGVSNGGRIFASVQEIYMFLDENLADMFIHFINTEETDFMATRKLFCVYVWHTYLHPIAIKNESGGEDAIKSTRFDDFIDEFMHTWKRSEFRKVRNASCAVRLLIKELSCEGEEVPLVPSGDLIELISQKAGHMFERARDHYRDWVLKTVNSDDPPRFTGFFSSEARWNCNTPTPTGVPRVLESQDAVDLCFSIWAQTSALVSAYVAFQDRMLAYPTNELNKLVEAFLWRIVNLEHNTILPILLRKSGVDVDKICDPENGIVCDACKRMNEKTANRFNEIVGSSGLFTPKPGAGYVTATNIAISTDISTAASKLTRERARQSGKRRQEGRTERCHRSKALEHVIAKFKSEDNSDVVCGSTALGRIGVSADQITVACDFVDNVFIQPLLRFVSVTWNEPLRIYKPSHFEPVESRARRVDDEKTDEPLQFVHAEKRSMFLLMLNGLSIAQNTKDKKILNQTDIIKLMTALSKRDNPVLTLDHVLIFSRLLFKSSTAIEHGNYSISKSARGARKRKNLADCQEQLFRTLMSFRVDSVNGIDLTSIIMANALRSVVEKLDIAIEESGVKTPEMMKTYNEFVEGIESSASQKQTTRKRKRNSSQKSISDFFGPKKHDSEDEMEDEEEEEEEGDSEMESDGNQTDEEEEEDDSESESDDEDVHEPVRKKRKF